MRLVRLKGYSANKVPVVIYLPSCRSKLWLFFFFCGTSKLKFSEIFKPEAIKLQKRTKKHYKNIIKVIHVTLSLYYRPREVLQIIWLFHYITGLLRSYKSFFTNLKCVIHWKCCLTDMLTIYFHCCCLDMLKNKPIVFHGTRRRQGFGMT